MNGWAAPWERCPDGVLQSRGVRRMGQRPRIPPSGEHRSSFISLVLRLSVSNNISPKRCVFCLLSSCHCLSPISETTIHTHGIWRAKAATPRALAKMQVLFSASLGLLLAKPSFTLPALLQVASAWFRGEEGHLCI